MIILLNGSINAGKTTVAQHLVKLLPRTAHVEVDDLRAFIRQIPLSEAIPINLENAVCVSRNFIRHGFHVVLTYPLGDDDYAYLIDQLMTCGVPIYTFTLSPDLTLAVTNRGTRELSPHEIRRIHEQYRQGRHQPAFSEPVDNSTLTPEETAWYILQHIQRIEQQ
jgi:tRNA splicing ligase